MAIENINGEATAAVVILDPTTGKPIDFGPKGLTLDQALSIFPTKDKAGLSLDQALAMFQTKAVEKAPTEPYEFALYAPVDKFQSRGFYGQPIAPEQLLGSKGDSISSDGQRVTLKGGKTYKLTASIIGEYEYQCKPFVWRDHQTGQEVGVRGATNGYPYNWNAQGQAVAIVSPATDTTYELVEPIGWGINVAGGDWQFFASSWMLVETWN